MSKRANMYRVGKSWYGKWTIEVDRNYPFGNGWEKFAQHSNRKLLTVIVWVLNKLDRKFVV